MRDHSEPVPVPTPRSRGPFGHPTSWVAVGAVTGGVAAYLFQILGTRTLGADAYAPIGVLWTLQYLLVSIGLAAIEAYVTRTVVEQGPDATRTRQVQRLLVRWLVVAAAVTGVLGFALRDRLFGGLGDLALVAALVVLAYGTFTIVRGRAAGTGRFRAYGLASASESLVRLLAAAVALAVAATTRSLAWVFPLGPALVTAWAALRPGRRRGALTEVAAAPSAAAPSAGGPSAEGPASTTSPSRFLASTVTANAAVQVLLAAGPLALVALAASPGEISVFFTTVTLARAPMTLVLNGGLSRVLPPLLRSAQGQGGGAADLRGPTVLTATVSVAAAATLGALAWLVGPPTVAWLFGASFRPAPLLAALATVSSVLAVAGLGIGQILIARGREAELPLPWLAGVVAAAALTAVLPGTATERVVVAFTAGLALALTTLTWRALSRPRARAGRPVHGR